MSDLEEHTGGRFYVFHGTEREPILGGMERYEGVLDGTAPRRRLTISQDKLGAEIRCDQFRGKEGRHITEYLYMRVHGQSMPRITQRVTPWGRRSRRGDPRKS